MNDCLALGLSAENHSLSWLSLCRFGYKMDIFRDSIQHFVDQHRMHGTYPDAKESLAVSCKTSHYIWLLSEFSRMGLNSK